MRKPKLVLLRSELGAGTRGASLGVDALKIAAIDLESNYFRKYDSIDIEDENWMLLEKVNHKYAKRIRGLVKIYNRLSKAIAKNLKKTDLSRSMNVVRKESRIKVPIANFDIF